MLSAFHNIMDDFRSQAKIRDEIYVQAMKQLQQNPSDNSIIRGWQLLHFLCLAAPPSPSLLDFVMAFAHSGTTSDVSGPREESLCKAGFQDGLQKGLKGIYA